MHFNAYSRLYTRPTLRYTNVFCHPYSELTTQANVLRIGLAYRLDCMYGLEAHV